MSGADTPDALAAAERRVRQLRDALAALTLSLWAAQSHLLAALASGDEQAAATWRAYIADDTDRIDATRARHDLAFGGRAAAMWAASPLRLVPRALTPDEAAALDAAQRDVRIARGCARITTRSMWEAQGRLLDAITSGDAEAEARARTTLAFDRDDAATFDAHLVAALDARAPLLAAQWEDAI